jgi:hypothetical protein
MYFIAKRTQPNTDSMLKYEPITNNATLTSDISKEDHTAASLIMVSLGNMLFFKVFEMSIGH